MINHKLSWLMKEKNYCSLEEAVSQTDMPKEELLIELQQFNQLAHVLLQQTISIEQERLTIPTKIVKGWVDLLFQEKEEALYYSEAERREMIFLLAFYEQEELSVFHFQEFFSVSKNTVLSDLRKLREFLVSRMVTLKYSRKRGFFIEGEESAIRSTAYLLLGQLLSRRNGQRLLYKGLLIVSTSFYSFVHSRFSKMVTAFNLQFVPSRFEEMVYFIAYLLCRIEKQESRFSRKKQQLLQTLQIYKASQYFLKDFPEIKNRKTETLYFSIVFMTVLQGNIQDTELEFLLECASSIIHEVERLAAVEFRNYRKLLLNLFYHLVPAYFRMTFGFPLHNVLIDEIKHQYQELFEITKAALTPLEKLIHGNIPEAEIGYFTILFGGQIRSQKERKSQVPLKALIVCPSGISSSLIMKSELQELFPQIDFAETSSLEQFQHESAEKTYDLIFSTVPIKAKQIVYVMKPIMSQLEKNLLMRTVQEDFLLPKVLVPSVNEIIALLLPHIELKEGITKEKLHKIIQRKMNKELKRREDIRPMLSELLTEEMIQLSDKPMNWEEAIALAAQPLKDSYKIEPEYIQAMIDKVKSYGAFIHIGQGVALPHARPEDGVNTLGMSLLKVREPVLLLDDPKHEIQIFICLAAVDNEMHLKALASLTKILSNKEKLTALLKAEGKQEIMTILSDEEEIK